MMDLDIAKKKLEIAENIGRIRQRIAALATDPVVLVAATKTVPAAYINLLPELGVVDFGENRVQEYLSKKEDLVSSLQFHMIGQLQANKIKYMIDTIYMIHSLDRPKLATELDQAAARRNRAVDVLIEVNVTEDPGRGGVMATGYEALVEAVCGRPGLRLRGLMAVMPARPAEACRPEFRGMRRRFEELKRAIPTVDTLSMGMSGDYEAAVSEGATMVRIGSGIFGARGKPPGD